MVGIVCLVLGFWFLLCAWAVCLSRVFWVLQPPSPRQARRSKCRYVVGAKRVLGVFLRGWFSLEDLARRVDMAARAAISTHRVSHYETRLFWLAVPGVNRFFRCLGTILPEWSRPGCRCARKGSLLPIKRATVSGSKGRAAGVRFQCAVANQPRNRLYAESGALQLMQPGKTYAAVFVRLRRTSGLQSGMLLGGHESFL